MRSFSLCCTFAFLLTCHSTRAAENKSAAESAEGKPITVARTDWPWWRGPNRDGIASGGQQPPLVWSETENVKWKSPLPGRGHGSPIVVGDRVFIASADHQREVQVVLCFNRKTGEQLWETIVFQGGLETKGNAKSSQASSTVACDGERVYANFLNSGAVYTTALDLAGKQVWQTKISDYIVHQGYGSSPCIYKSLVIVSADNKGGGAIAGLKRTTGEIVWRHERPKTPNYASPVVLKAGGREQLIFQGCDLVSSYQPLTGEKLWEFAGATTECVTSTVTDGRVVITSGGYPKNHVAAVEADGSGKVLWEKPTRVYVPSLLIHEGLLYAVADGGVAYCFNCETGDELWKLRLGGTFSASPVMVGEHLFATNEEGQTFIFKTGSAQSEIVGQNKLGNEVFATPTFCGKSIFMRVAQREGDTRQEFLYCLEGKE